MIRPLTSAHAHSEICFSGLCVRWFTGMELVVVLGSITAQACTLTNQVVHPFVVGKIGIGNIYIYIYIYIYTYIYIYIYIYKETK